MKLPASEDLDFHYLLELMRPLHDVPQFAWLPELFSIIGHEKLILLCKYAGGESITIPTLEQLSESIEALQWFYDVEIKKTRSVEEMPYNIQYLFYKIKDVYNNAGNNQTDNS